MVPEDNRNHPEEHFDTMELLIIIEVEREGVKKVLKHMVAVVQLGPNLPKSNKHGCNLIQALLILNLILPNKISNKRF
jgi:hypothetical protein